MFVFLLSIAGVRYPEAWVPIASSLSSTPMFSALPLVGLPVPVWYLVILARALICLISSWYGSSSYSLTTSFWIS